MDAPFSGNQVSLARELVAADRETRLELGDLLLEVVPWSQADEAHRNPGNDHPVDAFAAQAGLSAHQAREYRTVAWATRQYRREISAESGLTVSYAAISEAVLRSGGSAELLVDVCRRAADAGRTQVSVQDVAAARRAAVKAQADQRRLAKASDQADRARLQKQQRHTALAPYRAGVELLVAARVAEGYDRDEAELAVVTEIAQRIVYEGGNPIDLLELDSDVIDGHVDVVKAVRRRADRLGAVTRRLGTVGRGLQRVADDLVEPSGSDETVEEWLAALDQIITQAVDLAERLRERHGAAD